MRHQNTLHNALFRFTMCQAPGAQLILNPRTAGPLLPSCRSSSPTRRGRSARTATTRLQRRRRSAASTSTVRQGGTVDGRMCAPGMPPECAQCHFNHTCSGTPHVTAQPSLTCPASVLAGFITSWQCYQDDGTPELAGERVLPCGLGCVPGSWTAEEDAEFRGSTLGCFCSC